MALSRAEIEAAAEAAYPGGSASTVFYRQVYVEAGEWTMGELEARYQRLMMAAEAVRSLIPAWVSGVTPTLGELVAALDALKPAEVVL